MKGGAMSVGVLLLAYAAKTDSFVWSMTLAALGALLVGLVTGSLDRSGRT